MEKYKVAYQGLIGSYSYEAAINLFPDSDYFSYQSFDRAVESVCQGNSDFVILPVENTCAGRVMEVHSILSDTNLLIVGEYLLSINHCLFVSDSVYKNKILSEEEKNDILKNIVYVKSHPQALAQCKEFIKKRLPKAVAHPTYDTAGAVREVSAAKDNSFAAIGSSLNESTYNVIKILDNIQDIHNNVTRFIILGKENLKNDDPDGPHITTIKFQIKHKPGSLVDVLSLFDKYEIDLTKLETFMSGKKKKIPCFYVDILASEKSAKMQKLLREFELKVEKYSILGSYPTDPKRGQDNGFLS